MCMMIPLHIRQIIANNSRIIAAAARHIIIQQKCSADGSLHQSITGPEIEVKYIILHTKNNIGDKGPIPTGFRSMAQNQPLPHSTISVLGN